MPEQVNLLIFIVLLLFSSFFISLLINKLLIKLQNKMNYVQPLREELIPIHKNKSKTPTLGGIGIYLSSILTILLFSFKSFYNRDLLLILICTTGFFLIGLVDDLIKIIKNDAKGEKGIIKFVFEIFISFILLKGLGLSFSNFQFINIFSHHLFIGGFSIFLLSFILVGTSNSMNLTDGLDGLASTIFIIMLLPFAVYAFKNNYYAIGCYIVTMFGSTLGFIRYNINPSKQFMGDCGSLYLGSFIGSISILFHLPVFRMKTI